MLTFVLHIIVPGPYKLQTLLEPSSNSIAKILAALIFFNFLIEDHLEFNFELKFFIYVGEKGNKLQFIAKTSSISS